MYDIYYAHHQYKYKTIEETYELDLIRRYFPSMKIFNPATNLETSTTLNESAIMQECLETIRNSNILIFSSMDGIIGTGVYHEVKEAQRLGKIVFYIFHDMLHTDFIINEREPGQQTDRLYGIVDLSRQQCEVIK